jgi:quinol monooxygenase YgiN
LIPMDMEKPAEMLFVTLRINVPAHMTPHIISLFESYSGPVSVRAGCRSVNLYAHFAIPGEFMLVEEWNSQGALEEHVRSDDFRKVLAIMDLAGEPPELKFHTVSLEKGFELVESLRKEKTGREAGR